LEEERAILTALGRSWAKGTVLHLTQIQGRKTLFRGRRTLLSEEQRLFRDVDSGRARLRRPSITRLNQWSWEEDHGGNSRTGAVASLTSMNWFSAGRNGRSGYTVLGGISCNHHGIFALLEEVYVGSHL